LGPEAKTHHGEHSSFQENKINVEHGDDVEGNRGNSSG